MANKLTLKKFLLDKRVDCLEVCNNLLAKNASMELTKEENERYIEKSAELAIVSKVISICTERGKF